MRLIHKYGSFQMPESDGNMNPMVVGLTDTSYFGWIGGGKNSLPI